MPGEADALLERLLPPLAKHLHVVLAVVGHAQGRAEGPRGAERERHLAVLLRREHVRSAERVEQPQNVVDERRLLLRDVEQEFSNREQRRRDDLVEVRRQPRLGLRREPLGFLARQDPRVDHAAPLETLVGRNVQDARAADGRRRRVLQVADLEDHAHVRLQGDALVGRQGQEPVVVHDRVHGLDPVRVEVAVEHEPLRVLVGDLRQVS